MTAKALVITGLGLNCEVETAVAFEACGAEADQIHLTDLQQDLNRLHEYHALAFIGGFSFGDHLGAGTVFASRVKHHLGAELRQFIADGKLVIGICNGFQTLARMGLVPALDQEYFAVQSALAQNDQGVFRDDWVMLKGNPESPCVFTRGVDLLPLPIRHGEGKFVTLNQEVLDRIEANNQVAVRYADPISGEPTDEFPHNPNGSTNAIAGICDPTGRVFGLMPHPEAYMSPYNHPHWTRQKLNAVLPEKGLGLKIFQNAVDYIESNLL